MAWYRWQPKMCIYLSCPLLIYLTAWSRNTSSGKELLLDTIMGYVVWKLNQFMVKEGEKNTYFLLYQEKLLSIFSDSRALRFTSNFHNNYSSNYVCKLVGFECTEGWFDGVEANTFSWRTSGLRENTWRHGHLSLCTQIDLNDLLLRLYSSMYQV